MSLALSNHAEVRANQRGILASDIELVRACGELMEDQSAEVYVLLDRNVQEEIRRRKREIQRLEHLRGTQVVCSGDRVITVCRLNRGSEKNLLRR